MQGQKGHRPCRRPWTGLLALFLLWACHAQSEVAAVASAPHAVVSQASPAPLVLRDAHWLAKAWAMPVASRYRPHIEYQRNLSFCGPTSLANVAHSMGQSMDQTAVLEGSGISTLAGYLPSGITLDALAQVARLRFSGARVTVLRGLDLAGFRQHLRRVNEPDRRYIVNFSRTPLFGKGGGHHSPIAAFLEAEDLVLVLDVNQAFGSWLVKSADLLAAMNTHDDSAQAMRGLLLIEP